MTDHAQRAREIVDHLTNNVGHISTCEGCLKNVQYVSAALTQAHAAGRREGLEEAAGIADSHECGGPDDIVCQGMNCASIIEGLIRTKAKEGA